MCGNVAFVLFYYCCFDLPVSFNFKSLHSLVDDSLLGAANNGLLLFLLSNLGALRLDLTGTSEGTVYFTLMDELVTGWMDGLIVDASTSLPFCEMEIKRGRYSVALPTSNYPAAANFLPPAETKYVIISIGINTILYCQSQNLVR